MNSSQGISFSVCFHSSTPIFGAKIIIDAPNATMVELKPW